MAFDSIQHVAGGDIRPARFVKQSTAADYTVLEADANERVIGVATNATQDAPIPSGDGDAAEAGDSVAVNPIGSYSLIEVGSGGITRGALVKSDTDGKAVLAATTGPTLQWIGGQAVETASAGEFAKILVMSFPHYPALS